MNPITNKIEHTPGPWHYTDEFGPERELCYHSIRDECESPIASTWASPHQANARLIAAAPDLLAACRTIHAELDYRYDGAPDSTTLWMGPFMNMLADAIAKAERGAA